MPARAAQFLLVVPMYDSLTGLLASGLSLMVEASQDGGAFAPIADVPTEIGATGHYKMFISAAEMDAQVIEVAVAAVGARVTTANIATDIDTYQAKISVTDDDAGTADRYVVAWFKNGEPLSSGIAAPLIQVIKVADGLNLVPPSAMTQIGALGSYRYTEPLNRIVDGVAYIALASATIAGGLRTWQQPISRDSA